MIIQRIYVQYAHAYKESLCDRAMDQCMVRDPQPPASRESGGKASPAVRTSYPSAAEHLTRRSPRIRQTFSGKPGGVPVREAFADPSTMERLSRKSGVYRHRRAVGGRPETGPRFGR